MAQAVPPKLVHFVETPYPPALEQSGPERVEVNFVLTISAKGEVAEMEVAEMDVAEVDVAEVEAVSDNEAAFVEAATLAIRRFRFEPARRGEQNIPSRIRYRYVFVRPERPLPPDGVQVLVPPATLGGRVVTRRGKPIDGADVVAVDNATQQPFSAKVTDGTFQLENLPAGTYRIRVDAAGFAAYAGQEQLEAGDALEVTYRLSPRVDDEAFEAVASVDPPAREVTRRSIGSAVLPRVAGTRGDALRTVELLPGVARPPFLAGVLIVRGSSPQDSQVFYEGAPVPALYHFGGLTSFINSRLLSSIDFYPGNFSARYGRRIGGILEVRGKEPGGNGLSGVVDVNVIDASALVEGPIGDKGGFAFAARRSYIDFFFKNVVPEDAFSVVAAPVYYDYQAIASYRLGSRDRFQLSIYGSSDNLSLILNDPVDDDPRIRGGLDVSVKFHNFQLEWERKLSRRISQKAMLNVGLVDQSVDVGDAFELSLDITNLVSRAEWQARLNKKLRLIGGLDVQVQPASIRFRGPRPDQGEGNPDSGISGGGSTSTEPQISRLIETTIARPAVYLEADAQLIDPLSVIVGARLDWFNEIEAWTVDPRLVLRYALTPTTTLKGGVGLFSQPPEFQESTASVGNPDLDPVRAIHTSAGVEQDIGKWFNVGLEGFYKRLYDRVVGTPDGTAPYFVNDGTGNIYGAEFAGKAEPHGRWFGFLSYTLMRSERQDRGEATRLFDFDQTHILTLSGVYRIGRGWEFGSTFRFVTGNPLTPITGSVYNANADVYQPFYGANNSARNPVFHRLDVRVEKKWRFDAWKLAAYLDVQNAYNQQNREGLQYNYDFTEQSDIPGLPIIPSLGLRGEL